MSNATASSREFQTEVLATQNLDRENQLMRCPAVSRGSVPTGVDAPCQHKVGVQIPDPLSARVLVRCVGMEVNLTGSPCLPQVDHHYLSSNLYRFPFECVCFSTIFSTRQPGTRPWQPSWQPVLRYSCDSTTVPPVNVVANCQTQCMLIQLVCMLAYMNMHSSASY